MCIHNYKFVLYIISNFKRNKLPSPSRSAPGSRLPISISISILVSISVPRRTGSTVMPITLRRSTLQARVLAINDLYAAIASGAVPAR